MISNLAWGFTIITSSNIFKSWVFGGLNIVKFENSKPVKAFQLKYGSTLASISPDVPYHLKSVVQSTNGVIP